MTLLPRLVKILQQEDINFLLTNRVPRRLLTRFVGWLSKVEQPLVRDLSLAVWRFFSDLDLSDAKETRFRSMHACFIRQLKDGARPIDLDPEILVSPCDAIVGAVGRVERGMAVQVKGFPYPLADLLGNSEHASSWEKGSFVTLRLTSSMYHRFHAPHDCRVESVTYIFGDTWNVNPIALKRIERLFCKNERAVISLRLTRTGQLVVIVPVGAILVASIRLHFLGTDLLLRDHDQHAIRCDVPLRKGDEMGWFEHGSTIIMFVPEEFTLCAPEGETIRVGQALARVAPH